MIRLCNALNRSTSSYSGWTPSLERKMYEMYYEQAGQYTENHKGKRGYADCCLESVKVIFPNGLPEGNTTITDDMKIKMMKVGTECVKKIERYVDVWDEESLKQLKLRFYGYDEVKLLSENIKGDYVDCLAYKVKGRYPSGLRDASSTVLKEFIQKSRKECMSLIVDKYGKTGAKNQSRQR